MSAHIPHSVTYFSSSPRRQNLTQKKSKYLKVAADNETETEKKYISLSCRKVQECERRIGERVKNDTQEYIKRKWHSREVKKKKKKRVKSWIISHVFIKYYNTSGRNRPARRRSSLLKPGIRQEINRERVSCDAQFFNARYFQSAETRNSRTRPSFKERPHLNVCSTCRR